VLSRALSWRPLCLLGIISYGVYLWHWPVYVVLDTPRTGLDGWALFAVRVGVTLVIAVASYLVLESPIRHGALGPRQWRVLTPIAAAGLVVVIVFTTAGAEPSLAAVARKTSGKGPLVLVVGDSVGNTVIRGLQDEGLNVANASRTGCRIIRGTIAFSKLELGCPWPVLWKREVRQNRPAVVLMISGGWDLFDVQAPGTTKWLVPGTAGWASFYRATLERAVTILSSTGAHVVIPTMPYYGSSGALGTGTDQSHSAFNPRRVDIANQILAQVQAKVGDVLSTPDLNRFLSPSGK
jgi:hypothetical protein